MAVGQCNFPNMLNVAGIALGTACAGIKQTIKDDILVIQMAKHSTCAAVFTQNAFVLHLFMSPKPIWLMRHVGY